MFINWAVDWAEGPVSPSSHLEFWEENRVSTGYDTELHVAARTTFNTFSLRLFHLGVSCTVVVLTCFVMCGCFGNMCTCIYNFLYCFVLRFYIFSFMYIYSYLFCLYECEDCCHRVKTQLQFVVVMMMMMPMMMIIIIIIIMFCTSHPILCR